jgi:hypothetical protein
MPTDMPRIYNVRQKPFETAVDFPPMQAPASFSLTRVKEQIQKMINYAHGAGGEVSLR